MGVDLLACSEGDDIFWMRGCEQAGRKQRAYDRIE